MINNLSNTENSIKECYNDLSIDIQVTYWWNHKKVYVVQSPTTLIQKIILFLKTFKWHDQEAQILLRNLTKCLTFFHEGVMIESDPVLNTNRREFLEQKAGEPKTSCLTKIENLISRVEKIWSSSKLQGIEVATYLETIKEIYICFQRLKEHQNALQDDQEFAQQERDKNLQALNGSMMIETTENHDPSDASGSDSTDKKETDQNDIDYGFSLLEKHLNFLNPSDSPTPC